MTDDRKPKDMIGLRNHQGRSSLSLSDNDHPTTWIRRRRVDVEARNKGGHLTVKGTGVGLDGYYSIGQIAGSGIHVVGDNDAYGTFLDRGPFRLTSGLIFNGASIHTRFDGYGQTQTAERLGYWNNAQNVGCPTFLYTTYVTYNGTRYTAGYSYYFVRATYKIGEEHVNGVSVVPPARFGPAKTQSKIGICYTGVLMDDDTQLRPFIIRDFYGDNVSLGFLPFTKDQYPWEVVCHRISPTILVAMTRYKRSEYPVDYPPGTPIPNRIDNSKCPGFEIHFSYDNGGSWSAATSTQFFKEWTDSMLPQPPDDPASFPPGTHKTFANDVFNQSMDYLFFQLAPISATKAIIYGLVSYVDETPAIQGITYIHGKVKLGIIDAAAGTVMETVTLYQNKYVNHAWLWMGMQGCEPLDGGVLIVRAPHTGDNESETPARWLDPQEPGFTPDGVNIAWQPSMGIPGFQQGFFRGLGPKEIGATAYIPGRGYILRSTKDQGATWKDRALVTAHGVPPNSSYQVAYATDFSDVVRIRNQGIGANPFQSAPWAADSRVKAPNL